jgi:ABC-2 type transport system permease protein
VAIAIILEYRVTVFIWLLAGITPLIMMFVWQNLARQGEGGGRSPEEFALYFFTAFVVVQLIQAWTIWNVDYLVRSGIYSIQLLRPFDPWFGELTENIASNGIRLPLNLAIAGLGLWAMDAVNLIELGRVPAFILATLLAWQLFFNINYALALLALWTERIKSADSWNYIMLFALGGALFPLDLLSPQLRALVDLSPYPWVIGFPVSVLTGDADLGWGLFIQLGWIAAAVIAHRILWARGVRRFGAVGG